MLPAFLSTGYSERTDDLMLNDLSMRSKDVVDGGVQSS